ncbi:MAG: ABC transporter permease [Actinomycetota bacterium]|nr:ABC transporter permease [Actinomycetota bacterium]
MRYVLRLVLPRVLLAIITLVVVSATIFWAVELLPGDAATRLLGQGATAERVTAMREVLKLDQPPLQRYVGWLSGFVRGDWGESLVSALPSSIASAGGRQSRPVADLVLPRLSNTMILAAAALILYVPLSLILGLVTAIYRDRKLVSWLSALVLVATAIPEFVIGIVLLLVFSVTLQWFPPLSLIDDAQSFTQLLSMLVLPAVTLTLAMTAYAVRMMQTSVMAVMESDYVRLATLKGLSRRRVIWRHVLPNAIGPALRVTVLNLAWLIGGVVLVEVIFSFPGLGRQLIDSIKLLDTPVIEAIAMILAAVYIIANLGADLIAGFLNPRLRTG